MGHRILRKLCGFVRNVFKSMNNAWRSVPYGTNNKLKLYQSCVVSKTLYVSECWSMTRTDLTKRHSFHITSCLRIIHRIFWPGKIFNEGLLRRRLIDWLKNLYSPSPPSKKIWMLSSWDDDGDGKVILCGENHRQSPEWHFCGRPTNREREEDREQHGEEQLRARLMPCSILKVHWRCRLKHHRVKWLMMSDFVPCINQAVGRSC